MRYDLSEIKDRIDAKKRKFKIIMAAVICAFAACVALIVFYFGQSDEIVFWAALGCLFLIFFTGKLMSKYEPTVLFSPEIRGVNILEDEYALLANKRGFKMGSKTSVYAHHAGNRQLVGKERISARVYLRCDDGNVSVIDRIQVIHTDLYEEGDVLFKPQGVRYPIIESRNPGKQPCPICGRINTNTEAECPRCGLHIYK